MSPLNERTATSPFVAAPFEATRFSSNSLYIESSFNESSFNKTLDETPLLNETEPTLDAPEKSPYTIQVRETVPNHFTNFGSLDAWRSMARRRAFEAMLESVKSNELVCAQCHLSEEWEQRSANGERNLIITCDLNYWVEDAENQ